MIIPLKNDFNRQMQIIAARYRAEDSLLSAIAQGNEEKALAAFYQYGELMRDPDQAASPTSDDPLRDFKNSILVMNTLFRKAIEGNYVHPIYIHESSSFFGAEIEKAVSADELIRVIRDMVHEYCRLVREYSQASYSSVIRKALLFIDLNLASSISTREIAQDQFINPNYLSTRFKQETGISISEYILDRRVRLACQMLAATNLTVQEIAGRTGMGDSSYFSKQFRRVMGLSPLQYRKSRNPRILPLQTRGTGTNMC